MEERVKPTNPMEFLVAKYPSFQLNWGHPHPGGDINQEEKAKEWQSRKELRKKVVTKYHKSSTKGINSGRAADMEW